MATGNSQASLDRNQLVGQLVRGYHEGQSLRQLAAASGRSYGFVQGALKEAGVILRTRGRRPSGARPAPITDKPISAVESASRALTERAVSALVPSEEPDLIAVKKADKKKTKQAKAQASRGSTKAPGAGEQPKAQQPEKPAPEPVGKKAVKKAKDAKKADETKKVKKADETKKGKKGKDAKKPEEAKKVKKAKDAKKVKKANDAKKADETKKVKKAGGGKKAKSAKKV